MLSSRVKASVQHGSNPQLFTRRYRVLLKMVYLRTALTGRTLTSRMMLSLVIKVRPSPTQAIRHDLPPPAAERSTAIDLTAAAACICFDPPESQKYAALLNRLLSYTQLC